MKLYLILFTVLMMITFATPGSAYSTYADEIPGDLNGVCAVCHIEPNPQPGSGDRNPYGIDYQTYHSFDSIASLDSDGDGYTNQEELDEGTFPGDAQSYPEEESEGSPGFGLVGLAIGILGAVLIIRGRGR